jgi:hypothetical protein
MTDGPSEEFDFSTLTPDPVPDNDPDFGSFSAPNVRNGRPRPRLFGEKKTSPRQRTVKVKPTIPNRKGQFVEPITRLYVTIGGVIAIRDPHCGRVVVQQSEAAAIALDDLAYTDEFTRRILWALTQTGKYGAVFSAHLPISLAILIHHVPAISEAISYMGQAFADSVIRGEAMPNEPGPGPSSGPGNDNGAA